VLEKIRQIVVDSGLWNDGRESTHSFILSPDVYKVSKKKQTELEALGIALHDCLAGLGRIATIALNIQLGKNDTWQMISSILRVGIPKIYRDIMLLKPNSVPNICKVDLMESINGNYHIAEIDGHNKHGLGYSTLTARIRQTVMPGKQTFLGVAITLAQEIKRRGKNSIVLLYADQERFYLPEFHILQAELVLHGIKVIVIAESDVNIKDDKIDLGINENGHDLFFDFPFLYHNQALNTLLAKLYCEGKIDFLIPPKPFLGSKAILALLRNDTENEVLESILKSQIRIESLKLIRQYIPETYLVHNELKEAHCRSIYSGKKRFVLKESISSGMKGVVFSDELHFNTTMKSVCNSYGRFILQEEITNCSRSFDYFTDTGSIGHRDWFTRITVHYAVRKVADIIITATESKKVHGGKECLQLGAIIE
jgi:hypothetical protein